MVCIAQYSDGAVTGFTREDGTSFGVDYLADLRALGCTITYKSQAELDSDAEEKAISAKWSTYDAYCTDLTVKTDALNKFAASEKALMAVATRRDSMLDSDSILWVESWGSFQTTRIELQEVIVKANALTQAKITELFGAV